MKQYVLDTNVISEMRKPKPHGAVAAWVQSVPADRVFLAAVTLAELQTGIELTRVNDPANALEIELWVNALDTRYRILPMDAICFREWARMIRGRPASLYEDAMIAATARVYGLIIATRNERDFAQFGVSVLNPFR